MLDVSLLRDDRDALTAALARRRLSVDLEGLADLDKHRRTVRAEAEQMRAQQREAGKRIATLNGEDKQRAIDEVAHLADSYRESVAQADRLDTEFESMWARLPNMTHESVPVGDSDEGNVAVRHWGEPPTFAFDARDHQELGELLGIIDTERAARMSGSRFGYLLGEAVLVEFALVRFALGHLTGAGFTPVVPPVLVREEAVFGTGFFPGDEEQVYKTERDDLYLAATAEIPLASFHAGQIFEVEDLPRRYAGFSTCFRREAGTYGKDTKGVFRVHQFDKVEMFSFCRPEASWEEHEFLLAREEELMQALEVPYRVVNVCTGDLGASAAKKYDIEAWFPSFGTFRELTSCSNTTDYQARRLKVRYRGERGNRLVHTLNGTAVAIGRTLLAIMENHQRGDGSVRIPDALVPYTGFDVIRPPG